MSDKKMKSVAVSRAESASRKYSTNPSAVSHHAKTKMYKEAGLSLKKVYLGEDALSKLAEIYKIQYGKKLNVKSIDPVLLGDLLSYCINASYNQPSIQKMLPKTATVKIGAARTPVGQQLYRYHQMAQGTEERPDAVAMEPVFNYRNKRDKPLFPNIRHDVRDFLHKEIAARTEASSRDGLDNLDCEDNDLEDGWTTGEIQIIRDVKLIDKQIRQWNEVPPTLGNRKSQKSKP